MRASPNGVYSCQFLCPMRISYATKASTIFNRVQAQQDVGVGGGGGGGHTQDRAGLEVVVACLLADRRESLKLFSIL